MERLPINLGNVSTDDLIEEIRLRIGGIVRLPTDDEKSWSYIRGHTKVRFEEDHGMHEVWIVNLQIGYEVFYGVYDHWGEFDDFDEYIAMFRSEEDAKKYIKSKLNEIYPGINIKEQEVYNGRSFNSTD